MKNKNILILLAFSILTFSNLNANNFSTIPNIPSDFQNTPIDDHFVQMMSNLMNSYPSLTDEEYMKRLKDLSGQIDYRLDPLVKERILARTEKYRQLTEHLLGKGAIYFPIFEEYLAKYNVPHHLKYLSVIESHLNPVAKSVASAVGLWQFIPSSGILFGLEINTYVDERSDTHKASEAAANLLSVLYAKYNDWALAMAAYNCGPGRVDNAVKIAKSTDYWVVRNYLPKETQKYVPYFMAMVYAGEFHELHELKPEKMPEELVLTDTIHMSGGISMFDLAKQLEISVDTLKFLNPAYRRNFIPQSKKGQIIVLPARIVAEMKGYKTALERVQTIQRNNPLRAVRRINSQQDLLWLSKAFRCQVEDILAWNQLPDNYVPSKGDLIAIRKNNIFSGTSNYNLVTIAPQQNIQTVNINSLKVTGIDASNQKVNTIQQKNAKLNDGTAEVIAVAEPVKAATRHRIHLNTSSSKENELESSYVPKANSYESETGSFLNAIASNGEGIEKKITDLQNGIKLEDLENIIEPSYIDVKFEKASYCFEEDDNLVNQSKLFIPTVNADDNTTVENTDSKNRSRVLKAANNPVETSPSYQPTNTKPVYTEPKQD
jgi:membrane-bound lytic murein transglycosylase D